MFFDKFAAVVCAVRRRTDRFARDEAGSMLILALLLFTLMVMMGGLAVDLMRAEQTRVNLQQSLDRCTLNAAALNQAQDPESVVRDCMMKSGLSSQLANVTVTDGMNYRSVQSTGLADANPYFLHMLGIQNFNVVGASKAEQGQDNVEIALVLDVSGSMTGQKIANLKTAADEFVDTVFAQDVDHRVSITIVPYNAQVNLPAVLRDKFNATNINGVANDNCAELPMGVYDTTAIPLDMPLPMMAYADTAHGTNKTTAFVSPLDTNYARPNYSASFCKPTTVNQVRLPSDDPVALKAEINALQAGGNTSITLGMKWGVTLLDPSMRAAYADLATQGAIPANMPGRPFDYNDSQSMKVVVLMTDGEHVAHDRITDGYKTGPSGIFKAADGNYSVQFVTGRPAAAGSNEYWVPHLCVSAACTGGSNTAEAWSATPWNSGVQQDWKDIWANLRLSYVAWQFYARALGTDSTSRSNVYSSQFALMDATYESTTSMDGHLQQSCQQAKANGVIVYGIAVEAPAHGQDEIHACATSDAYYFDAEAATISTAFRTIATNITQLKLTQ
jgi:Flp pilus assembly protein TadG